MTMTCSSSDKKQLRKEILAKRRSLDPEVVAAEGEFEVGEDVLVIVRVGVSCELLVSV